MKRLKILIAATLVLTFLGIFIGCKKHTDKKPVCKMISATLVPSSDQAYRFSYDNDGRLVRVVAGFAVTTYDYTGNMTTVTNQDSGKFTSRMIVTMNDLKLATNVRTESDDSGANWANTVFEYNGEELSKSTFTSSAGGTATVSKYNWSGGNMVSIISATDTSTLEYYTDKPRQSGDFLLLEQTLQGYETYRNKNLLKGLSGADLIYEFGADGNISSLRVDQGGGSTFLDYQYQCN
jgi:YD repeat-containing protein